MEPVNSSSAKMNSCQRVNLAVARFRMENYRFIYFFYILFEIDWRFQVDYLHVTWSVPIWCLHITRRSLKNITLLTQGGDPSAVVLLTLLFKPQVDTWKHWRWRREGVRMFPLSFSLWDLHRLWFERVSSALFCLQKDCSLKILLPTVYIITFGF